MCAPGCWPDNLFPFNGTGWRSSAILTVDINLPRKTDFELRLQRQNNYSQGMKIAGICAQQKQCFQVRHSLKRIVKTTRGPSYPYQRKTRFCDVFEGCNDNDEERSSSYKSLRIATGRDQSK